MSRYRRVLALLAATLLLLTACAPEPTVEQVLAKHGLEDRNVMQIVWHFESMRPEDRPDDLMVTVTSKELLIQEQPDGTEHSLPLPEDRTYLSIAPYKEQTHDCFNHVLTSCQGEVAETEFFVRIHDRETGNIYVNGLHETYPNGFVGFWLPRDRELVMSLSTHADHGWEARDIKLSTASDAPTCITDVKLEPIIYVDEG